MQDEDGRTETDICRPHALDGCRRWHLACLSLWPGTIDRIYVFESRGNRRLPLYRASL